MKIRCITHFLAPHIKLLNDAMRRRGHTVIEVSAVADISKALTDVDVTVVHWALPFAPFLRPDILHLHGTDVRYLNRWHLWPLVRAKRYAAVSTWLAGQVPRDCEVMPMPTDSDVFRILDIPKENTILYVGRYTKQKNLDSLILAMRGLDAVLVMYGDGPERDNLKKLCHRHDIYNVDINGYAEQSTLVRAYNEARLTVLPSMREGFGLTGVESMLCGTPVLATPYGQQEYDPIICHYSEDGIRKGIRKALAEPYDRQWLRERVLRYNASSTALKYEKLLSCRVDAVDDGLALG